MEHLRTTVGSALRNCALGIAAVVLAWGTALSADEAKPLILITNVNVFDGVHDGLSEGMNVLIEGNLIKQVANSKIEGNADATVIDGGGLTLMPGLIDGHAHMMLNQDFGVIETNLDITDLARARGAYITIDSGRSGEMTDAGRGASAIGL